MHEQQHSCRPDDSPQSIKRQCLSEPTPPPPRTHRFPGMPPASPTPPSLPSPSSGGAVLPPSVDDALRRLCFECCLRYPDDIVLRELASVGEEPALEIMRKLSGSTEIRNLGGLIRYLVKNIGCRGGTGGSPVSPVPTRRCLDVDDARSARGTISPSFASRTAAEASPPNTNMGRFTGLNEASMSTMNGGRFSGREPSAHLIALGELEFRKSFLILSYIGRNKLEDYISVDMIRSLKHLEIAAFEQRVWNLIGRQCHLPETDRIINLDWDLIRTHVYHCYVGRDGFTTFKGPFVQSSKTHLQNVLGDDNVLVVKFEGRESTEDNTDYTAVYQKIAEDGIWIGLRRYQFFVFKDGGKNGKNKNPSSSTVRCYFVRTESQCAIDENIPYLLFNKSMREARCVFMHVHMVTSMAKYMPRFSLILSKTVKLDIDLDSVNIEIIKDIPCKDENGNVCYNENNELMILTDGTGFISEDLALKCPLNIFKGQYLGSTGTQINSVIAKYGGGSMYSMQAKYPPLLIQCRIFNKGYAIKGTLLLNKMLPPRTIHVTESMVKITPDKQISDIQCANSLEIVTTSYQPKRAFLSKYLIALLHYGGVPKDYFLGLLSETLEEVQNTHINKKAAVRVALRYAEIGGSLIARMILSGIALDEPYLQRRLSVVMKEEQKALRGGRLPVSESFYLMGTTDPTGILNANEVCVILENGQISGEVLVYRNPGLHFGDIHILKATYVEDLEKIVGNSKYAIFFPRVGSRSIADEIGGGDFDGDTYWVSRNPQLLKYFRPSKPWVQKFSKGKSDQSKPSNFSHTALEKTLFQQFLNNRFSPSYTMGTAADSWLSYMDRLLTLSDNCPTEKERLRNKMLQLVDIYYDALDAPKSGKQVILPCHLKAEMFPHFMEKGKPYKSTSILGLIYDGTESQNEVFPSQVIWKLPCFCIETSSFLMELWGTHFCQYRKEMMLALQEVDKEIRESAAEKVKQKYKAKLYEAPEFEESARRKEDIFNEALAIYHVAYDFAIEKNDKAKCSFAWEIAGDALCALHAVSQEKNSTIVCLQSVLSELVG